MKFMVSWSIDQDKWLVVLKKWGSMTREERADTGSGVKMIGRWHDMAARRGVAIIETTDLAAMQNYLGQWNASMDMEVAPVLDDEESAAVSRSIVASHGA